jgi:putative tricarboxylic transport membrane protein
MKIDRIIGAATLLLAAVYLYATAQIPTLEIGDPLGPKAFPVLLGIALIAAAILLFIETLKPDEAPVAQGPRESFHHLWLIGGVVVWTALYFGVFDLAGYLASTTIYLLVLTAVFNRGHRLANILTSVLWAVGSYVLFVEILGVTLAKGAPPIDMLSTAVDVSWKYAVSALKSLFGH